ncbi:hypothetical protein PsorP6_010716 [Peronosclerospora sorghi]|uniref:Uncharacterized protein n=1 Tax=Peronosclerospora sorghi TaxID=230839 RepID=A0ACC0VV19_9STRA|nr:hypothetical protein PsorP6_010716 [Peronosclerospora sorghi]
MQHHEKKIEISVGNSDQPPSSSFYKHSNVYKQSRRSLRILSNRYLAQTTNRFWSFCNSRRNVRKKRQQCQTVQANCGKKSAEESLIATFALT